MAFFPDFQNSSCRCLKGWSPKWVAANDLWYTFAANWERFCGVCHVIPSFESKMKKFLSQIFEIRPGGASSGGHPNRQLVG